jgi:hypothetical protein
MTHSSIVRSLPAVLALSLGMAVTVPGCGLPPRYCVNPGDTWWVCHFEIKNTDCECALSAVPADVEQWVCASAADLAYAKADAVLTGPASGMPVGTIVTFHGCDNLGTAYEHGNAVGTPIVARPLLIPQGGGGGVACVCSAGGAGGSFGGGSSFGTGVGGSSDVGGVGVGPSGAGGFTTADVGAGPSGAGGFGERK